MSTEESPSAMRRKVAAGQREYQSRAMTAARALRLTVPKVADDQMELALGVIGLTQGIVDNDEILDPPPENRMMLVLDGPDGRAGAALVDGAISAALVQQQTMGRVTERSEAEAARIPTRTEAALMSPFLDQVFEQAAELPDSEIDALLLAGRRFGAWIEAPRLLAMALEDPEYQRFTLTLDVAGGVRQGKIDLFLPIPVPANSRAQDDNEEASREQMARIAMSIPAQLTVALCRPRMSLSELSKLAVGDVIDIPKDAFSNAQLLAITGRMVGHGRLGQVAGKRAVRLTIPGGLADGPKRRAEDGAQAGVHMEPLGGETIDMPALGGAPDLPDPVADLPATAFDIDGDLGGIPDLPDVADLPDVGDLPALGDAPDMPDLPDMPELDALPDLPDLPDMPDLPDLPDLPGLPDLAETGS